MKLTQRLQALGNPVTLRNSFGKGYILELTVEERSRNNIDK